MTQLTKRVSAAMSGLGSKEIAKELAKHVPDKPKHLQKAVIEFIIRHPQDTVRSLLPQQMSEGQMERCLPRSAMSHTRRISGHFVFSSYPNGAPEEESYSELQTIPDATQQMEFNISSATQVGHQLALIGDEFNRIYHGKFEDTLLHLAHRVAISVFQTWNNVRSVIRTCGNTLNNNWTKRMAGYGSWICRLSSRCTCQKLVPAALLAVVICWWAVSYGAQN